MKVINLAAMSVSLIIAAMPSAAQQAGSEQPAFLEVRTSGSNLNMRTGPSGRAKVVTSLPTGTRVRNIGCQESGRRRWCQVSTLDDPGYEGWMSARFLIESGEGQVATETPSEEPATEPVAEAPATEPAKIEPAGEPSPAGEVGGSSEIQVQLAEGTNGGTFRGALSPGESRRYVLNGDVGQSLLVNVTGTGPDIYYQLLNPDSTFLLDQVASSVPFTGELWQSGDHVVEVINRSDKVESYIAVITVN